MAQNILNVEKLTSVPSLPTTPNTIFLVAPSDKPDFLEIYVSNRDGTELKRSINENDVKLWASQYAHYSDKYKVVDDIHERDSLVDKSASVFVRDATGDPTVKKGGAFYIFDAYAGIWVKISEAESLDVTLSWENIDGRPDVTAKQITDAVGKTHTHLNAEQLHKIDEEDGKLTYNGKLVGGTITDTW